jgi:hypothetical protein
MRSPGGQLGKPNNDTRLPPRMVVPTNKACPEARLFPRHAKHAFRFGRTREQIGRRYALDRAARAVPRRRGAGQYVGLDGSARRIGRSARCRSRPGRRSASTEEGDSTSDSEIDARPPRIALNASGFDQWAFRPVIRSGCVKRSLMSAWIGHGNGRQQRWLGRNAGRPGRVTRRRGPVLATNSTGRGRRVAAEVGSESRS